ESMEDGLKEYDGCITLHREPFTQKVLDFNKLGFIARQPSSVADLIQNYFDALSDALFERFWAEHFESQYMTVVAGADLLDRPLLESLPGTGWFAIFWGVDVIAARGMATLKTE